MVRRRAGAYSATDVARRTGLSRPYVYYLVKRGLLIPSGPSWGRREFDEDAIRMATILVGLQRRGIGPDAAVRAVKDSLEDYGRRISGERLKPLQDELARLTGQAWELLDKASEAGSVRAVESDLLALARHHQQLRRQMSREADRLGSPPADDPAWRRLQEFFGNARLRDEFVALLKKTRGIEAAGTSTQRRES